MRLGLVTRRLGGRPISHPVDTVHPAGTVGVGRGIEPVLAGLASGSPIQGDTTTMQKTRLSVISGAFTALLALAASGAVAGDLRTELDSRRAEIAKTSGDDAAREHYLLGLWARDKGLTAEAQDAFRRAIEIAPDHVGARDALGHVRHDDQWLTQPQAMEAKGLVLREGRWILREEAAILDLPAEQRALRREQHAKTRKLLGLWAGGDERTRRFAEESLGTIADDVKLEPFAYSLRSKSEDVRKFAANELGRLGDRRALKPLLHRAVFDPSEDVRHASIAAAKTIGDPNLVLPLVRALASEDASVRSHAAESMGRLGDVRGVKYLVYKFEAHGGGAPRVYSMFANQLTFIQDFDVEVAQTAFIADPIVGVIQEGIVLDVTVVATEQIRYFVEREVIHVALNRLTGAADVRNEDGAWAAWYREHGEALTASAAKK